MPIIGTSQDRLPDLIAELIEKLDDRDPPEVHVPAPVVNVDAPNVHVPVTVPPATVTVQAATPNRGSWTFAVSRNSDGLIETITATPKN